MTKANRTNTRVHDHTISSSTPPYLAFLAGTFVSASIYLLQKLCICALFILVLGSFSTTIFAQKDSTLPIPALRVGLFGGYGLHQHSVNFSEFRTSPLFAPRTTTFPGPQNLRFVNGAGLQVGGIFDLPFSPSLALSLRLSYAQHLALLTTQEQVLLGDVNGTVSENIIEYRINAIPSTVGLDALLKYTVFGNFNLLAGVRSGVVLTSSYSQDERLLNPARGSLNRSGEEIFNPQNGVIPDVSPLQIWASGGISYDIPLATPLGTIHISPEILYSFALTNLLQAQSVAQNLPSSNTFVWNLHHIRGSVGITLPLSNPSSILDSSLMQSQRRDSLARLAAMTDSLQQARNQERILDSTRRATRITNAPLQKSEKKVSIYAQQALLKAQNLTNTRQIDIKPVSIVRSVKRVAGREISDEQEYEKLIIPVQELLVRDEVPLLPYLFFDGESSTKIPERYHLLNTSEVAAFSPESFKSSSNLVLGVHPYYDLLNILGYRLKRFPQTKINILGCTDGFTSEKNRPRLSEVRANVVAEYLRSVWGIDSTRLVIADLRGTSVSVKASRPLHESDKQAENRRVELSSDTLSLFAPILLTDTIQHTLTPSMRFYLIVPPTLSVKSWKIRIKQDRQVIKEFRGTGKPPLAIDWRVDAKEMEKMTEQRTDKPTNRNGIECQFDVIESDDSGISSPAENIEITERRFRVNAEERVENMLVERQTLILFDGGKSTLTQEHLETLKGVNARMTANSKVVFEGFMDKSGDEEFNERLSLARAQAAAKSLRFNIRGAQVELKGYGSNKVLYDGRLPEGRIYSRAVRITQETPLQD
jgi:outer membrane protein OmpA-like peptidoglycan-associated protein